MADVLVPDGRGPRASGVVDALDRPLPGHTEEARRALLHELRGHGRASESASVEVFRFPGRLLVRLSYRADMSRTEAERLATHVTQAVRGFDRWAPVVDVTVVSAEPTSALAD
jgi:hypothetical protein